MLVSERPRVCDDEPNDVSPRAVRQYGVFQRAVALSDTAHDGQGDPARVWRRCRRMDQRDGFLPGDPAARLRFCPLDNGASQTAAAERTVPAAAGSEPGYAAGYAVRLVEARRGCGAGGANPDLADPFGGTSLFVALCDGAVGPGLVCG